MAVEHYVVRQPAESPDLLWIAYVDYDTESSAGAIRWQGGLEGQVTPIVGGRAVFDGLVAAWRETDGFQVDRID
jgi:hypothetical protein